MKKTFRTVILTLLSASLFACSSLEKRDNKAKAGAPIPLDGNSGYIFFSHFTTTGDFPGKLIIKKQNGKSDIGLTFSNISTPSYALYEVEPGNYDAIGFSAGNDPLGDAMGTTISARLGRKWDVCAGCVLYAGRLRLDFTRTANGETTNYGLADASVEDLKRISEFLVVSKQTKMINDIKP